jgi:hypothetical protein
VTPKKANGHAALEFGCLAYLGKSLVLAGLQHVNRAVFEASPDDGHIVNAQSGRFRARHRAKQHAADFDA